MDRAKGEPAPDTCFPEGTLPFLTRQLIVRWLLLVGPDGLDDVRASALAVGSADEQL